MNELKIDVTKRFQTFARFGVSGAWWAQVVGGWTEPDPATGMPKRERIAELLFDPQKGIGVRCYRYNLGAGSANSGRGRYALECRRAESFDTETGAYDWSRDENAVWMLRRAVALGADEVVFFVNSPPERLTRNGKAYLDKAGRTNLAPKNYKAFADYCLDVVSHFISEGLPVRYLSPVNEPVWVWTEKQEGCHYRPWQVYRLLKVFAAEMEKRPALKELKLSGAENGDVRWFNKTYCFVMLHNKKVRARVDAVDVHSYCITPNVPVLKHVIGNRRAYLKRFRRFMDLVYPGVPVRTSEWCHMQGGRDYGMPSAMEQTRVMIEDLTLLNVTSWQLWIAVSNVDYCDGLIYENDGDRTFALTKRYYAFGQFSKFIRPGAVRVAASAGEGLWCVAFLQGDETVCVVANPGEETDLLLPAGAANAYMTSDACSLAPVPLTANTVRLPHSSVLTVICRG